MLSGAFSGVFIVTGLVATAGLRSVLDALPWIAFAVGLALIVVGVAMVAGRRISLLTAARLQPGAEHRAVKRFAPVVNRVAGTLLVVSGASLAGYLLPALGSGTPNATGEVAARTERISSALADFFATHTAIFAATLAAVLVLGAALAAQRHVGRRHSARTTRTAA